MGIQDVTHVFHVGRQLTNPDVTISLTNGRRIWACRDGVAHTNAGRGIANITGTHVLMLSTSRPESD